MGEFRKKPGIGDRVQITGFLGEFEVVQIKQHGLVVDLKHLLLLCYKVGTSSLIGFAGEIFG